MLMASSVITTKEHGAKTGASGIVASGSENKMRLSARLWRNVEKVGQRIGVNGEDEGGENENENTPSGRVNNVMYGSRRFQCIHDPGCMITRLGSGENKVNAASSAFFSEEVQLERRKNEKMEIEERTLPRMKRHQEPSSNYSANIARHYAKLSQGRHKPTRSKSGEPH